MPTPGAFDGGELAAVARFAELFGEPPPGEVWVGDDAAVLAPGTGPLLFATDACVEGVHFDRDFDEDADIGWMALVANLSDVAAMGGRPIAAVAALAGASGADLEGIAGGLAEAGRAYACPIVGGDLSVGPTLVVSVAITGTTEGRPAVLRRGGHPGDELYVTGPLGAAGCALRLLRAVTAPGRSIGLAHRRPLPRLAEGRAAADLGARAMLDLSDGLGLDLFRLASASGCGADLDEVPVAPNATLAEAIGAGGDYELLFAVAPGTPVAPGFVERGLREPRRIGALNDRAGILTLNGEALPPSGYLHDLRGG